LPLSAMMASWNSMACSRSGCTRGNGIEVYPDCKASVGSDEGHLLPHFGRSAAYGTVRYGGRAVI
jgi:hypothetical protein